MCVDQIRLDFPILSKTNPFGNPLVYLDNAATTHKPKQVISCIENFYKEYNSNIHRGAYWPASEATSSYEKARATVSRFIKAESEKCIVFTSGTTDSINKLAASYLEPILEQGDEILISEMEHHSNLIPWQQVAKKKQAGLKRIPLKQSGELDLVEYKNLINSRTKLIAVTAVSNTLGTICDLQTIVNESQKLGIPVFVDAAQSVPHYKTDLTKIGCDFLAFSAHKIYGPTGIGVLYTKEKYHDMMAPANFGGGMIKEVSFDETIFADFPARLEAGTPNICGAIAMAAAIDYIEEIGWDYITKHNVELVNYAMESLSNITGLQIIGDFDQRAPVLSFNLEGIHPHDVAQLLSEEGIAIRAGHHCTQPLMDIFGIHGTCRVSFAIYNHKEEIDKLKYSLLEVIKFFK